MSIGGLNQTQVSQYYRNRNEIKNRRNHYKDRIYKLKSKSKRYVKTSVQPRLSNQQIKRNKQSVRNQIRHNQVIGWLKTIVVLTIIGICVHQLWPQIKEILRFIF